MKDKTTIITNPAAIKGTDEVVDPSQQKIFTYDFRFELNFID
jgi:hypothetical protein